MLSTLTFIAFVASLGKVFSQTSTACNPTNATCPPDAALGKAIFYDFTKGPSSDFSLSTGAFPTFTSSGAQFAIAKHLDAPTMSSNWYIMFGHYDVVLKAAPGQGVISSVVLQSDDLDEIDLEWLGANDTNVQSNYFGKGNTQVYDRGQDLPNPGAQEDFHTYSLDWTADHLTWSIHGQVLRTLTPATADVNQYPQTPMKLKIGTWASGDPSDPPGVIEWGGGPIDYSKGPFTMTVQSVRVIDYSTGPMYSYSDMSGTWQSIKSSEGKINTSGDPNTPTENATMSGSANSTSVVSTSTPSAAQLPTSSAVNSLNPSTPIPSATPSIPPSQATTLPSTVSASTPASTQAASTTASTLFIVPGSVAASSSPSSAAVPSSIAPASTPTSVQIPSAAALSSTTPPQLSTIDTCSIQAVNTVATSANNPYSDTAYVVSSSKPTNTALTSPTTKYSAGFQTLASPSSSAKAAYPVPSASVHGIQLSSTLSSSSPPATPTGNPLTSDANPASRTTDASSG